MKDPRDVILAPIVSEKSYDAIESDNVYTFVVDRRLRPVPRGTVGEHLGKRKDEKYAMVKLAAGDTIDIFGV